jgi:hypothetical protein
MAALKLAAKRRKCHLGLNNEIIAARAAIGIETAAASKMKKA